MSDLISRQAAIDAVTEGLKGIFVEYRDIAKKMIGKLPTAEPERKTGKWIPQTGGGYCCSQCGRYALHDVDGNFALLFTKSKYCPNCGAKMEMEDE